MIGSETANHFIHHGKTVTLIELLPEIAKEEPANMKRFLLGSLKENGVDMHVNTMVKRFSLTARLKSNVMVIWKWSVLSTMCCWQWA